ncbi:HD domain-containing phosphohydrolase [Ideonella sp. DXS22W]|uniref:HD domain-containing phosphohydrolase n=1 Tax=Pseudaquabacterium inlustre TaxID=2984192 RepID=A0ABU9CEA2_9BURK
MVPSSSPVDFSSANPHALDTILEASETRSIIAARDIVDLKGVKLWARNQPVTRALQERLMDRGLKDPLESSLRVENGVDHRMLGQMLGQRADQGLLMPLLQPVMPTLRAGLSALNLHSVAQLLLTAAQTARPVCFAHAVDCMAVCGAIAAARNAPTPMVAAAMTAGLLHDIGEIYMAPEFGEADIGATLDAAAYQQLVVHPHIGQLLLAKLTDYRADVIRAVGEHHERLDGSGFPLRRTADTLSVLGRLVAVAEAALAALRPDGATLQHASVALRVMPGEFDDGMAGPVVVAARRAAKAEPAAPREGLREELAQLDIALQAALNRLDTLAGNDPAVPLPDSGLVRACGLARHLLLRLRTGWNESGLWSPAALDEESAAEAAAVQDALRWRLRAIERMARLTAGELQGDEADQLDAMCAGLVSELH